MKRYSVSYRSVIRHGPFLRSTALCILVGAFASLGMTGNGCFQPTDLLPRMVPVIIPAAAPADQPWHRTYALDLRSYPEAESVSWEFGDGAVALHRPIAAGRTIAHNYQRSGTFVVKAHLFTGVEIPAGHVRLLASASLPVDVVGPNLPPIAAFAVEDVLDEQNEPVTLTNRFVGSRSNDPDGTIVAYRWDFGDGTQAAGETIEHAFAQTGQFEVRLTVEDDRGATGSATKTVVANTRPVARFTHTVDPNDALTFTLDASASSDAEGEIVNYRWDFGDDSAVGSGQVVVHTYTTPADYTVRLTVTDVLGASGTATKVVDVTGSDVFVRSIDPDQGVVNTTVSDVRIDGENFQSGATVRLEQGATIINAASVNLQNAGTIRCSFNLANADLGSYTLVVTNPDNQSAQLADAFRVITANLVRLETSLGDIVFELVDDAPVTTANFLQYVDDGFYDGTIFHRVVPGFVVQGGGFLPGMVAQEGLRDPIVNEFSPTRSNLRATVAMAKVGGNPDSATSQFFVNLGDNSQNLDNQNGGFTVFARVVEGMDVVDAIAEVPLNGEQPADDVLLIRARRE